LHHIIEYFIHVEQVGRSQKIPVSFVKVFQFIETACFCEGYLLIFDEGNDHFPYVDGGCLYPLVKTILMGFLANNPTRAAHDFALI
jgi:hypothetical protein